MKFKGLLSIIICMIVATSHYGQSFNLVNNGGVISMKKSDVLVITIPEIIENSTDFGCDFIQYTGKIESIFRDSVLMNVEKERLYFCDKENSSETVFDFTKESKLRMIAQDDIFRVENMKKSKRRKTISTIGAILFFGGALTTANALIFSKEGHKQNLVLAGVIEMGVGLTITSFARRKRYYFKKDRDPWRFSESVDSM